MYRSLPKGAHGRTDPEIQAPFLKKHFPFIIAGTGR